MEEKRIVKKKETGGTPKAPEKPKAAPRPKGPGGVTIISGPMVDTLGDLIGMKVSEAADTFGPSYGAAPGSTILVNGKAVDDKCVLADGDTLEFVRRAGEKGTRQRVRTTADGTSVWVGDSAVHSLTLTPNGVLKVVGSTGRSSGGRVTVEVPTNTLHAESTGLMHPWLRQHTSFGLHNTVVVECPPHARTIRVSEQYYRGGHERNEHTAYADAFLSFPWVVLVASIAERNRITHLQVYYRNDPMKPGDTGLSLTNLLNVTQHRANAVEPYKWSQHVCLGDTSILKATAEGWLWGAVDEVVHRFFRNGFNGSAAGHMWDPAGALHKNLASFKAWEKASRTNPGFILKVPWQDSNMVLKDAVSVSRQAHRNRTSNYCQMVAAAHADKIYIALQRG